MLSFTDALAILDQISARSQCCVSPLGEAIGRPLAEDVAAPIDLPLFSSSAMDGYLLSGVPNGHPIEVLGAIYAGKPWAGPAPESGQAVYIATGGLVPEWGWCVVPVELVQERDSRIIIMSVPKAGDHIRPRGQDCGSGETIFAAGFVVQPNALATLRALGLESVLVWKKPRCWILATGDEVMEPGSKPGPGQVYDVNGGWLQTVLPRWFSVCGFSWLPDDELLQEQQIRAIAPQVDLIVISGGMSVGRRDFSKSVLEERFGCHRLFHKVAQKPGKPLYLGHFEDGPVVVGLPGNPAAAMACTWIYMPHIAAKLEQGTSSNVPTQRVPVGEKLVNTSDRTQILWGNVDSSAYFRPVARQNSHLLVDVGNASVLGILPTQSQLDTGMYIQIFAAR